MVGEVKIAAQTHAIELKTLKDDLFSKAEALSKDKEKALESLRFSSADDFMAVLSSPKGASDEDSARIKDVSKFLGESCDANGVGEMKAPESPLDEFDVASKHKETVRALEASFAAFGGEVLLSQV